MNDKTKEKQNEHTIWGGKKRLSGGLKRGEGI